MCGKETLDLLDLLGRALCGIDRPFGGIRIILSGDFMQLASVCVDPEKEFCFLSDVWLRMVESGDLLLFDLRIAYRQADEEFLKVLEEMRFGELSEESIEKLKAKCLDHIPDDPDLTHIYPTRDQVREKNKERLEALSGQACRFVAQDSGSGKFYSQNLDKETLAQSELWIKVGARVMCLINSTTLEIHNGLLGVVTSVSPETVSVLFDGNPED
jgi:ATP-dependent DNA helicase PIF1